ncbi:hypothetical protein SNOG_05796 [Parastagonospora nodorum SN15]|uniref:Uncharacterized protein n=1 Tax=Phaeosphaeria nodorum (strain SN15 / ATCC MYA-4574 / FGSC 10173) TaxID=321614 RepID=Q0UR18_PHANO|nr:hypothetical protein SNOG_05796 [Parastagonospora nodorum SN15]EAT86860.1 hypothetical protein SNOG_05796 [Parastagonospora nodorum SN15]
MSLATSETELKDKPAKLTAKSRSRIDHGTIRIRNLRNIADLVSDNNSFAALTYPSGP